ncbi:hypothetical protein LXA43DRAFT_1093971 [Ganoderma leucocontextum]|nr:hypothetical protein LXA43DRAFT_1093971 [Ganoderma leucocontextum]
MSSKTISLNAFEHPVKAVTIFQSSTAQLTRTFTVDLKSGSNVLEISSISSQVDKESPRIYGLGTDARVFDMSCNAKLANAPHQKLTKNAAAIKKLVAKRKLLEAERNVRQTEFSLLDDAARSLAQDKATSFDALMDTFVVRKRNAMRTVLEMDEQIEELEKEIWLLDSSHKGETATVVTATLLAKRDCKVEFQLIYLVTGVNWQPYYDLHASTSDGKPSSDVSLHYCANITQNTGEDWTNTVLTLSTANSQALHSLTVPKVDPLRLLPTRAQSTFPGRPAPSVTGGLFGAGLAQLQQLQQQQQQQQQQAQAFGQPTSTFGQQHVGGFGRGSFFGASQPPAPVPLAAPSAPPPPLPRRAALFGSGQPGAAFEEDFEDIGEDAPDDEEDSEGAEPEGAVLDKNPLSLAYRVEGRVSLPSDGVAHKVSIAVLGFSAALKYVCVPRKTSAAFIEGRIKNTSEYELLAGPVSVFMDNSFVTKTLLGLIGVNESFTCVLGIDTSLKMSSQPKFRTVHEPRRSFAEPFKTTTRTVITTITNGHSFDVSGLVVRDAIPLGNNDANIKVALRRPDGLAQAKDGEEVTVTLDTADDGQEAKVRWARTENGGGGEKEGLYEWVCELKAGKKIRLETEWEVKAPSSMRWEEQPNIQFGRGKRE